MIQTIKVKYLVEGLQPIMKQKNGDWVDLRAAYDCDIRQGEYYNIPLGVAIKLPEGYEAILAPRSSTFKNYGILMANSIGIIDESYCGNNDEWHFPAYATEDCHIEKNDRICQFRIMKHQEGLVFRAVDNLDFECRGGFGTSGRK